MTGPRWDWIGKTALGALGTVIMLLLGVVLRGQERIEGRADEAVRQAAAGRAEIVALGERVTEQKEVMDKALLRLQYFRSDADKDWTTLRERVLRLELEQRRQEYERNRRHDLGLDR